MVKGFIHDVVKDFKEGFREGRESRIVGTIINYVKYKCEVLPIIYSPESVRLSNSIFATVNVYQSKYRIVVDDLYINAPDEVKEFINQHEFGHLFLIENGDPNMHTLLDEIKADKYAMEQIGQVKSVNALNYVWIKGAEANQIDKLFTIPSRLKELGADVSDMCVIGANGTFYEADLRKLLEQQ